MMSLNRKHYLIRIVAKLVESSDLQKLPKSYIYSYVPVNFSRLHQIWSPLSKLKRASLVGCTRKKFTVFKRLG